VARYFFNLHDGRDFVDDVGSEHSDLQSVRAEAVESLGERLRGRLLHGQDDSGWLMNVTDEAGVTVMIISLAAAIQLLAPAG
jgi:hypothetical protein